MSFIVRFANHIKDLDVSGEFELADIATKFLKEAQMASALEQAGVANPMVGAISDPGTAWWLGNKFTTNGLTAYQGKGAEDPAIMNKNKSGTYEEALKNQQDFARQMGEMQNGQSSWMDQYLKYVYKQAYDGFIYQKYTVDQAKKMAAEQTQKVYESLVNSNSSMFGQLGANPYAPNIDNSPMPMPTMSR